MVSGVKRGVLRDVSDESGGSSANSCSQTVASHNSVRHGCVVPRCSSVGLAWI